MSMDQPRFFRVVDRATKMAGRAKVNPVVKAVYDDKLAPHATRYVAAYRALEDVEAVRRKEKGEALAILEEIDQPYREARTALNSYVDDVAVPMSLKSRRTATDKSTAIEGVHALIERHKEAHAWARAIAEGAFGRLAPIAIREIDEWIVADEAHEEARRERADAYKAAYPMFLIVREQVGASYGTNSIHYRRLVVRDSGKLEVDDVDDVEEDTDVDDGDIEGVVTPTDPTA